MKAVELQRLERIVGRDMTRCPGQSATLCFSGAPWEAVPLGRIAFAQDAGSPARSSPPVKRGHPLAPKPSLKFARPTLSYRQAGWPSNLGWDGTRA